MRYDAITKNDNERRKEAARLKRQTQLYTSIFRDVSTILKILYPSDRALPLSQNVKSIMYALIEIKTGKRPDKF